MSAHTSTEKLSLLTRKNIRDKEADGKKRLLEIADALGIDFTLDVNWAEIAEHAQKRGYENRAGEIVYGWYLGGLTKNLQHLAKDDLSKEAVVEACTEKKIALKFVAKDEMDLDNYVTTKFINGVLTVCFTPETFCSNVDNTGSDIEKRL